MQLHNRTFTCGQQHHTHPARKPIRACAVSGRAKLLISCARSRKSASPAPQDDSVQSEQPETAAAPPEAAVPLVRSNRRAAATGRNLRSAAPRTVASPVQKLREKGIIAVNEEGETYVNVACLGEGKPRWYALALLENKEDVFISLITTKLEQYGYTIAPTPFQPAVPKAAAASNAEAAAAAADALAEAQDRAAEAQDVYQYALGQPGEAGAAARVQEAAAVVAAAQKLVDEIQAAAVAAAEAAAATALLLQQYDLVVWKPKKKMTVYSHNTDRLVDREVTFSRGTGGATLLIHCTLDPLLADLLASTYYFMEWRFFTPVSAVLLNQNDMLPDDADLEEVFKLPEPCTDAFLLQVSTWQHTRESEDLEAERKEYYGSGGGSPFGARPEKGSGRREDRNNPSRWSVSAGPTNAGAAALIAAGEPLPWEQEQQEGFGRGRGRGRNARGGRDGRGGRGGRGGERQPWQQQQQQAQYAPAQFPKQQQGFREQGPRGADENGIYGGYDNWDGGRGRGQGRGRGRGRQQQEQQQQWRQQDEWQHRPKQQQRGYAVAAATSGDDEPGAQDSFSEENRQRQMDYMNEMGSGRYRDGSAPSYADEGGRGWKQQQQQQQQQQPRQQWQQQQPGAGRDGGTTRMRQLDFTGDMGSDRYSDDEDRTNYDRLEGLDGSQQGLDSLGQQQQQQQRARGGKDNGATMKRQLGFMAEMGSDRYSDDDDDDVSNVIPRGSAGGRGGSRGSSGNFSSLLSEFADAMDYMDDGSYAAGSSGSGRNNAAAGQGFASNPSKASYMDEDTLEWGRDVDGDVRMGGVDEGAAAAQAMLQEWQSEGQPGKGGKQYAADLSTRSREGLGASFEFDAGPGLASADSLLGQLPDAESLAGLRQQQQQEPPAAAAAAAAPKRKGRAGTTSRSAKKTEDAAAADGTASSRRKTSTRKAAAGTKKQQGAAAAADVPLDGWVGGADASDEGYEEGWIDRIMDDGNNRTGLDDVMRF